MWGSQSITVTDEMISSRPHMIEKKRMLFRVTRIMLLMLLASELSKGSGLGVKAADMTEFSNNQHKFLPKFYNRNKMNCMVQSNDKSCQLQTLLSMMLHLNRNKLHPNLKAMTGSWHPWNDASLVKKNSQSDILKNINIDNLTQLSRIPPNYPSHLQPPQSITNQGKNFVSALDGMIPMELMSVLVNCMRKCEVWRARVNYYNCMKLCKHENKILDDMERKDEKELGNRAKSQNVVQRNSYGNGGVYRSNGYAKSDNLDGIKRNCLLEKCFDVKDEPQLAYSTGNTIENIPYSQEDASEDLPYTLEDDNQDLPDSKVVGLPYTQQDSSSFLPYTREADMDCDTWPCIGSKVKRDVECLDGECGGGGLVMPRKRRWGDTLTTCISSHCNSLNGVSRVDCIINKCDKHRRG